VIKKETIDRVRAESDIVQVIGGYLPLRKVGKYWRGVCPFHPDKSPSFYVSPERQVYHCFGCGAGGSVVNFVMAHDKIDFPEAIRVLAGRLNIEVLTEKVSVKHQGLYDACEFAARFFEGQLGRYSAAVNYLLRRGMKDETVKRFRLGYAPGGTTLRVEARKAGLNEELLLRAGLLNKREQGTIDWFFGRVMCPILSLSGRVIGFSGRVLDSAEPKYLNSTESEIFRKGEILFGLFQAKHYIRQSVPLLVEGNFDLLALANRGINNVIAPLGTAFTPEQALLIRRFNSQVRVLFDADSAGRSAARRVVEVLLRTGLEPGVLSLPDGLDPDDYIRKHGPQKLLELSETPRDVVDFLMELRKPERVSEKNATLRELLLLIAAIPDPVTRELHLNRVAGVFQVAKDALQARIRALIEPERPAPVRPQSAAARPPDRLGREEKLLALAARNPKFAAHARDLLPPETFVDPALRELATRLYQAQPAAGLAGLTEVLTDDALRRRVTGWEFRDWPEPSEAEFRNLARSLRSRWLSTEAQRAESEGDLARAERLRREHFALRKSLLQRGD
jgi:DNA primase